jgi:hypothetical protein
MRNLGVSLLFVLSLIAFFLTLEMKQAEQVRIEPAFAKPENAVARPIGVLFRDGYDGGLPLQGTIAPLRELDVRKLERAYKLGLATRPER